MPFTYHDDFPQSTGPRAYGYIPDQIPRLYSRQPPSPTDGSSNSSIGGGQYIPSDTDLKLDADVDPYNMMVSSDSYHHGDQHSLLLPGPHGPQFVNSMGGHGPGPSGSLPDLSGSHFPQHHPSMYGNYPFGTGGSPYDMGLSQMHGLGSALPEMQNVTYIQHSPSHSDTSLEEGSSYSSSSPPPSSHLPPHDETEDYLRRTLEIPRPKPVDLNALPDPVSDKKQPPITNMIKLAIWGSKHKRLTLRQIYDEIEKRFPALKENKDKPWQRSIRHNLSLKAIFVRVERPVSHPGKGFYWALDCRAGEGNKRDRKRKDQSGSGRRSRHDDDDDDGFSEELDDDEPAPQRVLHGGGQSSRRGHQPLRLPQETQFLPGPYSHSSGSLLDSRGVGPPLGANILNPGYPSLSSNAGPNMRWDQRPQYSSMPPSGPSSMHSSQLNENILQAPTSMGMQLPMHMSGGTPPPGFSNYNLPSNIEHRSLRRTTTDPQLGRHGYIAPGYPQSQMSQAPMGYVQPSMISMPSHGPSSTSGSSSGSRRPSPDEEEATRRSSRRPRIQ